jgi:hypothetical protein
MERNSITLVRHQQHLGSKRCTDELSTHTSSLGVVALSILLIRDLLQHLRDRRSVLCVKIGVDLVKEVEGRGIALLDCEDKGKGTKT